MSVVLNKQLNLAGAGIEWQGRRLGPHVVKKSFEKPIVWR